MHQPEMPNEATNDNVTPGQADQTGTAATNDPSTAKPAANDKGRTRPIKVVSARQLAANRNNAKRSTGPKTVPGKARSSRNALKYGIYADVRPIERGTFREDPIAVQATVDDVIDHFKPRDAFERAQVMRIANVMIQIGRHQAFATFQQEQMTSHDKLAEFGGPGLFEADFNAEFYAAVAEILLADPKTYTLEDWHDLLLAAAAVNDDVRELYTLLELDEPASLEDAQDMILSTLQATFGSLANASAQFAAIAEAEAARIPDAAMEAGRAAVGIAFAQKMGSYEAHTRILSRLSAALDREIKRFQVLRAMASGDDHADDTDDREAASDWDDYEYRSATTGYDPPADPEERRPTLADHRAAMGASW